MKRYVTVTLIAVILVGFPSLFAWGVWRYGWEWTGFYGDEMEIQTTIQGQYSNPTAKIVVVPSPRKLWDWMQLAIVPIVLAAGAFLLNRGQRQSEQSIAKEREEERILQAYLEAMTEFLLKEGLRDSEDGSAIRDVTRARTLAVLREVNSVRQASIVRFLTEAELIGEGTSITLKEDKAFGIGIRRNVVSLVGADLNLEGARLNGAKLNGAKLSEAKLSRADLSKAKYNSVTKWPHDFNPAATGAINVDINRRRRRRLVAKNPVSASSK